MYFELPTLRLNPEDLQHLEWDLLIHPEKQKRNFSFTLDETKLPTVTHKRGFMILDPMLYPFASAKLIDLEISPDGVITGRARIEKLYRLPSHVKFSDMRPFPIPQSDKKITAVLTDAAPTQELEDELTRGLQPVFVFLQGGDWTEFDNRGDDVVRAWKEFERRNPDRITLIVLPISRPQMTPSMRAQIEKRLQVGKWIDYSLEYPKNGVCVAIAGVHGAGKTTTARSLKRHLKEVLGIQTPVYIVDGFSIVKYDHDYHLIKNCLGQKRKKMLSQMALTYALSLLETGAIVLYIIPKLSCDIIEKYLGQLRQKAETLTILLTRDDASIAADDPRGRIHMLSEEEKILPCQSIPFDALISTDQEVEASTLAIYDLIKKSVYKSETQ